MPVNSDTLKDILGKVLISWPNASIIDKLLNDTIRGGWEVWLQVEYAAKVLDHIIDSEKDVNATVVREAYYNPKSKEGQKTDLFFEAAGGGVQLWVELKTQHTGVDHSIFARFYQDISKIISIWDKIKNNEGVAPKGGKEKNVMIAMAVVIHPKIWGLETITTNLKEAEKVFQKLEPNITVYAYVYARDLSDRTVKWYTYNDKKMYDNLKCVVLVGKLN